MHCPASLLTIAPGRTPGQVPVPAGAAAGTGISLHFLPPSVQLEPPAAPAGAATPATTIAADAASAPARTVTFLRTTYPFRC